MDAELTDALFQRYPMLFRDRLLQESCLHRGIECGNGWYDLIDALCASITFDVDHNVDKSVTDTAVIVQIKQKFGSLRVYVRNGTDYQLGMAHFAGIFSERVCECCGAPGKVRKVRRTYAARCEAHSVASSGVVLQ